MHLFVLRGLGAFSLCGSRKWINATYWHPGAFNGFDQLMFMHCFEDVNILMKVYTHIFWQTIFSTEIPSKQLYDIQCNKAKEKSMWLSAEHTCKDSKWFRCRYLWDRSLFSAKNYNVLAKYGDLPERIAAICIVWRFYNLPPTPKTCLSWLTNL